MTPGAALVFYRCVASVTARWAAIRWTGGVGGHVINRRMSLGDAIMVLGRSQGRESEADQRQQSAKKDSSDRHVALLKARTIPLRPQCCRMIANRGMLNYMVGTRCCTAAKIIDR